MYPAELSDGSTLFVFGSHDDAEVHASMLKPNAAKSEVSTATDENNVYETSAVTNSMDGQSQEAPTSIPAATVELSGADAVGTEHPEESSGAVLESRATDAADGSQHTARAGDNATDLEAARLSKSPNISNMQLRDSLAEMKVSASHAHHVCHNRQYLILRTCSGRHQPQYPRFQLGSSTESLCS